jgi:hypothetical protein
MGPSAKLAAPLALGVLVAFAPSCRQVAGIHVLQSQEEECAACVAGSCSSQESACLPTASCASRLDCALACDPSSASCETACEVQPAGDADELGAVDACVARSCASTCGLSCGGLLPPIPPSSASTCSTCIAAQCCTSAQACAESAQCSSAVECARSQSTPDALYGCEVVRYPGGAALYSTLATCVQENCTEACEVGSDWSCVGEVSWPQPTSDSITGTLTIVDVASQSQTLPGLSVTACFSVDLECQSPVSPAVTTDANGQAVITVPTTNQGGQVGFVGYLKITDPTGTYLPELVFAGFPRTQTGYSPTIVMVSGQTAQEISMFTTGTYDPTSPVVIASVTDCAGAYAPDVSLSVESGDGGSTGAKVYYTSGTGVPDLSASATSTNGTAIVAGALPGFLIVSTHVAAVKAPSVASWEILTRAATVSLVLLTPTPTTSP